MRVWLAPSAFAPHRGGVEELTAKLGQHLLRRGHDVLVVTNRWPLDLAAREQVEGLPVVREEFLLPGRDPRSWLPYRSAARSAQSALNALPQPDLVHIQCPSSQTPHLVHFAGEAGIPLVVTTQGETYMDAGGLYHRSPFARRNLRRAARSAAALTACSRHAAEGAAAVAPGFATARVVRNGIDSADWAGLPTITEPVVAAWGRHVPQKGFDLLLRAFELVRAARPQARLLIGGDGPESGRLERLAGPGVTFVGRLDRSGVRALLAESSVVAVPSRVEPFGIVALESLAAGRGLVYSTRGGLSEAAGPLGRAADPYDVKAFADALLLELAEPTAPRRATGHLHSFSWEVITQTYLQIYQIYGDDQHP